jgi:hypothetical protein
MQIVALHKDGYLQVAHVHFTFLFYSSFAAVISSLLQGERMMQTHDADAYHCISTPSVTTCCIPIMILCITCCTLLTT